VLVGTLAMIVLLGGLTLAVVLRDGPDPLTLLSALVLALLGVGILGGLREPPA
jgi:hypothetical protein